MGLEPLESRRLLAAVSWDGGAGDSLWNSPANWSNDVVPGPADDVTIDVALNPTIRFLTTDRTINSLVTRENLQFEGATLTVKTTAAVDGARIWVKGGSLAGGAWSFTGGGGVVTTSSGGTLTDTAMATELRLSSAGSKITLAGSTSFTTARLSATGVSLTFATGSSPNWPVLAEGALTGTRTINIGTTPGSVTLGASAVLRLASGAGGGLSINVAPQVSVTNNGLISNEALGQTLEVLGPAASVTNAAAGTIQTLAGPLNFGPDSWTNAGTLKVVFGATFTLNGALDASGGVGTILNTGGGVLNLSGTIANAGNTLALNSSTGSLTLLGGKIIGGVLSFAGGSTLITTISRGTLTDVSVAGELLMNTSGAGIILGGTTTFAAARLSAAGASINVLSGAFINSPIFVEGSASGSRSISAESAGGTVTFGPATTIRVLAGAGGGLLVSAYLNTLLNHGLISNEASGQTLTISAQSFTNSSTGRVRAMAGTVIVEPTNWKNSGVLEVASGATITLRGTLDASAGLGTLLNAGAGVLNLNGTIANSGNTISLNASTGTLTLLGALISGGSISLSDGLTLLATSSGGTLENVLVNGEIALNTSSAQLTLNGTTSFTAVRLTGSGAVLRLAAGYTLNSLVLIEGAQGLRCSVEIGYTFNGVAGTSTIGPSGIIRVSAESNKGVILTSNGSTLINNGLVTNDAPGQTLTISGTSFTNGASGIVRALAGVIDFTSGTLTGVASCAFFAAPGSTLRLGSTTWSNAGSLAVDNATLILAGAFSTSGFNFAGFSRTAGTVVMLAGTLSNTGSTLALNAQTGSWVLAGGVVVGGTIALADGAALLTSASGGTLTNTALLGELLLDAANSSVTLSGSSTFAAARLRASGAQIRLEGGYTLNSLISVEGASSGDRKLSTTSASPVTIGPSGVVRIAPGAGAGLSVSAGSLDLLNYGLISSEADGQTLTLSGTRFTGITGTVQAIAGSLLLNATDWTSSGVLRSASGGTLILGGRWTTSGGVGSIQNPGGGQIRLSGNIVNTGNTISLSAATGSLFLAGAVITGGAVSFTGGASLAMTTAGGSLVDVAVGNELVLDTDGASVSIVGTTSFPAARLSGGGATPFFNVGYTLNSPVLVEGAATTACSISWGNGIGTGSSTIGPAGIIRLAAGAAKGLNVIVAPGSSLTNQGLISGEAVGRTLTVSGGTSFTNTGIVQVLAGTVNLNVTNLKNQSSASILAASGSSLRLNGNLNSSGALAIDNATLTLAGLYTTSGFNFPGFTRTNGGVVNLTGTFTNTASTLALNAATGSWTLMGGTVTGGTLSLADDARLITTPTGGTLTDVALGGELLLSAADARVTISGSTTFTAVRLSGGGATVSMTAGYTLNSLIVVEGSPVSTCFLVLAPSGAGTVTFGPSAVVRIAQNSTAGLTIKNGLTATLVNRGVIQGLAVGRQLVINCSTFTNNGTVEGDGSDIVLSSATITNFAANTISGGVWMAGNGGSLTGGALANIKTLNATVVLEGASSGWDALSSLELISQGAQLKLAGGADQTIAPASGVFTNSGTLILGVGSSLAVTGHFVQTASATLETWIAGGNPDSDFGSVSASGAGQLAGTLNILAMNGYEPARPDIQAVVKTGGVCSGAFSTAGFPQTTNPDWKTVLVYTGFGVQLLTTSIIDFNNDGLIDLDDFFGFFDRWDRFDATLDLNGDGAVDLGDYFVFFDLWAGS